MPKKVLHLIGHYFVHENIHDLNYQTKNEENKMIKAFVSKDFGIK
jgi:hypothetical protein